LTSQRHSGQDVRRIIAALNAVLCEWGNYFRTGHAERESNQLDRCVVSRLRRWQSRRGGHQPRHVRCSLGSAARAGPAPADGHGEVPVASHTKKVTGKPGAGKWHARLERGRLETGWYKPVPR